MMNTLTERTIISVLIAGLLFLVNACDKNNKGSEPSDNFLSLSLNLNDRLQQIHSFGASDAWSIQFVGNNWPLAKREQIAELLFSTSVDDTGNPKGAGLSGWRFNIGAGSAEQAGSSEINDEWRRAACFLNSDGSYDWNKHPGQRWFLQAAKSSDVEHITAFVNSPPVHLTKNGKAWSGGGSSTNLRTDKYEDYVIFLATVIKELESRENINFSYISPFNEPQWDWDNKGQEGSPYLNSEIADITRLLSEKLTTQGIPVLIELTDAAHIAYIYEYRDKPERGNQAYEFFAPESDNYVGDLANVATEISGHSYYSTYPLSSMIEERQSLANGILTVNPKLKFWQSEYCLLESNDEINGNGRDLGIDPALYTARLIHYDLTEANSVAWYWWLAVSPYDYKDGLVYIDKNLNDGKVYDSKILWALGNYSRFIRPGMYRFNVLRSDNQTNEMSGNGLMVSGYAPADHSKAVFVMVNYAKNATYPVKVKTTDNRVPESINLYITSAKADENLKFSASASDGIISVPPRSVVTVVMEF